MADNFVESIEQLNRQPPAAINSPLASDGVRLKVPKQKGSRSVMDYVYYLVLVLFFLGAAISNCLTTILFAVNMDSSCCCLFNKKSPNMAPCYAIVGAESLMVVIAGFMIIVYFVWMSRS